MKQHFYDRVSAVGLLVALGIIYGDIGTSPLYTMKAIIGDNVIDRPLVYGGISCVFWTLTLQTTLKYVILTLQADNNGEGGIFSLYTLVRHKGRLLAIIAIIGGSALLADGIITPPISVSSAIEGLRIIYPEIPTIPIVVFIITLLFGLQILGTTMVGKSFGPIMMIWFTMLGVLGLGNILANPDVLAALNPYYAFNLLTTHPEGFWILGAVFLCTTGAEALYSDMGHCGKQNIRVSWIFVKICLVLNYFGQGAWLMTKEGSLLATNPFYAMMPQWFLIIGIGIATLAAIIASQALISGSFTLVSEAVRLNFWPKVRLLFPSETRGQIFVPAVNTMLWIGCVGVVLYFRESHAMEAAYGLAITITMLMTTILLTIYLIVKKVSPVLIGLFLISYLSLELSFLSANLLKFMHGGYVSLILCVLLMTIMWVWKEANEIKNRLTDYTDLEPNVPILKKLSTDESVPKYATHLVYMTKSSTNKKIENTILFSILKQKPKRADIYWLIHVETTNDPYTREYKVDVIAPQDLIRITFRLGFKVEQLIGRYFAKVVANMVENGEVDITSRYQSLQNEKVTGDFTFIVTKKFLSYENNLPPYERVIMKLHFLLRRITISEKQWFGLDDNNVEVEKIPLLISPVKDLELQRID
ncbi:MAG TPA: KUP/HAK/KT family potassium transporter [Chryseosolibacter sp.]